MHELLQFVYSWREFQHLITESVEMIESSDKSQIISDHENQKSRVSPPSLNPLYAGYESQDYLPPHSDVYLTWLKQQPRRNNWDKWVMMALIGLLTGVTGFFLHQIIDVIADTKWRIAKKYISQDQSEYAAGWVTSLLYRKVFFMS